MKHRPIGHSALFVLLAACETTSAVTLPMERQEPAPISAEWSKVDLKGVRGTDQTRVAVSRFLWGPVTMSLARPLPEELEVVLRARIGTGGTRPITMTVENVRFAYAASGSTDGGSESFGIAAELVIGEGSTAKRIRLEHSVNAPVTGADARKSLLTRAVLDLADRILFHPQALAAIGAPSVPQKDSALIGGPKEDLGPVLPVKSREPAAEATGRVVWGSGYTFEGGQAQLLVGKEKGGFGVWSMERHNRLFGTRLSLGLGGLYVDKFVLGSALLSGGLELGYRGTWHDDEGYVSGPGVSFLIVPTATAIVSMGASTSDKNTAMTLYAITYGANIELGIPIGKYLGLTAGLFVGSARFGASISTSAGTQDTSSSAGLLYFPFGDIYLQTSTGRFSLGVAFEQITQGTDGIKDLLANPKITLTYQAEAGHGIAYAKEDVDLLGWTVDQRSEVRSGPQSAFLDRDAVFANATPPPKLAGAAAVRPLDVQPISKGRRWLVLVVDRDDKLGTEGVATVRALLETQLAAVGIEVVKPDEVARYGAVLGVPEPRFLEAARDLAGAADAARTLIVQIGVQSDGDATIEINRSGPRPGHEGHAWRAVRRASLLTAVREEVLRLTNDTAAAEAR